MVDDDSLEVPFPGLSGTEYRVTSQPDRKYNCIAWAAGDSRRWWWPDPPPDDEGYFWPLGVSNEETVAAFVAVFATLGYEPCSAEASEPDWEKIVLYASADDIPTHAARQLANGRWSSKLGRAEDIEHDLRALEGAEYGKVVQIFKRRIATD
jgi:hypothetical protein